MIGLVHSRGTAGPCPKKAGAPGARSGRNGPGAVSARSHRAVPTALPLCHRDRVTTTLELWSLSTKVFSFRASPTIEAMLTARTQRPVDSRSPVRSRPIVGVGSGLRSSSSARARPHGSCATARGTSLTGPATPRALLHRPHVLQVPRSLVLRAGASLLLGADSRQAIRDWSRPARDRGSGRTVPGVRRSR